MKLKMSVKRKTVKAKIIATNEDLVSVGIDFLEAFGDLEGRDVDVYDIDKYWGMHGLNSGIIVESINPILKELNIKSDFIIPTKWLKFV